MTILRLGAIASALLLSIASGGSQSSYPTSPPPNAGQYSAPASEPMDPSLALGLYRTSFGPVKIEVEPDQGMPAVHGVWVYDRQGEEVIGYFSGMLNGNVLEFDWEEPADPQPLRGQGFLVFHSDGTGFYGKWWTTSRDRSGDWTGQKYTSEGEGVETDEPPEPEPEPEPPIGETI